MKTAQLRDEIGFCCGTRRRREDAAQRERAAAVSPTATHSANGIPGEQVTGDLTLMSADCGTCT